MADDSGSYTTSAELDWSLLWCFLGAWLVKASTNPPPRASKHVSVQNKAPRFLQGPGGKAIKWRLRVTTGLWFLMVYAKGSKYEQVQRIPQRCALAHAWADSRGKCKFWWLIFVAYFGCKETESLAWSTLWKAGWLKWNNTLFSLHSDLLSPQGHVASHHLTSNFTHTHLGPTLFGVGRPFQGQISWWARAARHFAISPSPPKKIPWADQIF